MNISKVLLMNFMKKSKEWNLDVLKRKEENTYEKTSTPITLNIEEGNFLIAYSAYLDYLNKLHTEYDVKFSDDVDFYNPEQVKERFDLLNKGNEIRGNSPDNANSAYLRFNKDNYKKEVSLDIILIKKNIQMWLSVLN